MSSFWEQLIILWVVTFFINVFIAACGARSQRQWFICVAAGLLCPPLLAAAVGLLVIALPLDTEQEKEREDAKEAVRLSQARWAAEIKAKNKKLEADAEKRRIQREQKREQKRIERASRPNK